MFHYFKLKCKSALIEMKHNDTLHLPFRSFTKMCLVGLVKFKITLRVAEVRRSGLIIGSNIKYFHYQIMGVSFKLNVASDTAIIRLCCQHESDANTAFTK